MNRKVRLYRVITYCIAFYAALAFLLLGPVGILKSDRMVAGNEVPAGNVEVRLDRQVQQVIVAEGTWLRYLDLYVTSEDSAGKTYNLLVYDSNNERLLQRQLALQAAAFFYRRRGSFASGLYHVWVLAVRPEISVAEDEPPVHLGERAVHDRRQGYADRLREPPRLGRERQLAPALRFFYKRDGLRVHSGSPLSARPRFISAKISSAVHSPHFTTSQRSSSAAASAR